VSRPDARALILGSMPGAASLEATQYYAFLHNVFWKIMGELFGVEPGLDYPSRLHKLMSCQIALWDVVATCHRPGSLDSAIAEDSVEANDFDRFFARHSRIIDVYFNGQTAAKLFRKKVQPGLQRKFSYLTLPSTSPANATMNYAAKLEAWSVIKLQLDAAG